MTNNDITNKALDYCCGVCGSELVKKWDNDAEGYDWYCSKDNSHTGYKQKLSPGKALQRGQADELLGPGAQKDLEKRSRETNFAFSNLPKTDAGDFSLVTLDKVEAMLKWADSVGLNAYLGHVELYYGEPRVSIDGYYYLNNKRKKPYRIGASPMCAEVKTAYGLEKEDFGSIAQACLEGIVLPEVGIGIVKAHELDDMSKKDTTKKRYPVVSEHPQRMAEKRAEWQLLRKLIPLEVKE